MEVMGELLMHYGKIKYARQEGSLDELDDTCSGVLGEANYYTWAEVEGYQLGTANMIVGRE